MFLLHIEHNYVYVHTSKHNDTPMYVSFDNIQGERKREARKQETKKREEYLKAPLN
jgi:hypothetical protein